MAGGPGSYLFGAEEMRELMDVMLSGYLFRYGDAQDPAFKQKSVTFEREFAAHVGLEHAVATSSGTGSLLCCLAALGIGAGDEVIVPGYTFIASLSSIVLAGAIPVLAEIDESLTLDPADVEKKITPRTKAIMPVHMLGNPCRMDAIIGIARRHNLKVIEDCCQAVGGAYQGKKLGAWGDIAAYSLNLFKTITAGDGGVVATNDDVLYERAFGFHDQGHKPNRTGVEVGNRNIVGMNMRMNELTGAVSLAQLRKLNAILARLHRSKERLKSQLGDLPGVRFRTINDEQGECATLLTLLFDDQATADRFCDAIGSKTISHSGWHVYNNMEQMLALEYDLPEKKVTYHKHMLPRTDDILARAVNISIGVVDKGLGSAFGISILSEDEEIDAVAARIRAVVAAL